MNHSDLKISIIDYELGNTKSVANALNFLGYKVKITDKIDILRSSTLMVLPGVGAFGKAVSIIKEKNLFNSLSKLVIEEKKPIIGICLGMQLFGSRSQESPGAEGFNFIPGEVKKIDSKKDDYCVPHVGWNGIEFNKNSKIYQKIKMYDNFYFDHSYHFDCDKKYISSTFNYAQEEMVSSIHRGNILGIQFHPEKSQNNGLKLLRGAVESLII